MVEFTLILEYSEPDLSSLSGRSFSTVIVAWRPVSLSTRSNSPGVLSQAGAGQYLR